jgi:type I restriction enzyme S subunit
MKAGWQSKTLGEVLQKTETVNPPQSPDVIFDYIDVSSVSNKTFRIEETQSVKGKDAPSRARRLVKATDILFATVRPTLQRIAIVPGELDNQVCSTGYFVLRPKPGIDHRFVFYSLFTEIFMDQMASLQKGASYPAVTDGEVRAQRIMFPPLPEQQRIVGILDEAFECIATAKANAEKNLQNARALFESHLQSVFTQRGEGWVEKPLGEMCERITKGSSPKWQGIAYVDKPGILFVTSENVGEYQLLMEHPKYVEEIFNEKDKKSILKPGDVLTNIVGASIGRTTVFNLNEVANINQAVCLIRCESGLLNNFFLTYLLNSPVFKQVLHDNEVDNARANLSLGFFSQLPVPRPPIPKQIEIVAMLDASREETQRLESLYQQKLAALEALKKSLLNEAFSGQL